MKPTKLYKISQKFAQHENLPVYFVARQLTQTNKAMYLYGRGTTETKKMGVCCACGRTLTHPVSVELGIGPECGKHYWDWDAVGGYTKENIARLTKAVQKKIRIDSWVPKSVVKEVKDTDETVPLPKDHKMIKKRRGPQKKKATQVEYQNSGLPAIKITFPFSRKTVKQVKTISGRKFHNEGKNNKYWTAPRSVEAVEKLQEFGFDIDEKLLDYVKKSKVDTDELDEMELEIPGLGGELFPFQKKGVKFVESRDGRALIADEMGLGKTIQALAWCQLHPEKRPVIIVCPASLKLNWKREAEHWMDEPDVQILNGTSANQPIVGDVIIINYHILKDWVDRLNEIKAQILIGDEIHYTKNNKAKRTKAYKKLAKGIPHHIPMSGTPINNRPVEILNAIQMVDKSVAPDRWHFLHKYCDATHNGFGWDFSGASNTEELHEKLTSTIMIRRKKKDVLTDLPDKIRSFVPIELDNEKEYTKAENDLIDYIRDKTEKDLEIEMREKLGEELFGHLSEDKFKDHKLERLKEEKAKKASAAETLVKIETLKQLAVKGKLDQAIGWIKNFLDSGDKLVVFCTHKFTVNRLMDEFSDIAVKVDGSVSGDDRDLAVQQFQNHDKVKLFVGNVQAAGVGLTLTAASTVAFLELPWTPGDVNQAEDRVHRIGQDDSVNIYYLLAENTIEERIAHLIDEKRKILDSVLDGEETDQGSLLSELMDSYKQM